MTDPQQRQHWAEHAAAEILRNVHARRTTTSPEVDEPDFDYDDDQADHRADVEDDRRWR